MVKAPKSISSRAMRYEPFYHQQKAGRVLARSPMENSSDEKISKSNEREELRFLYGKLRDIIPSCQSKPTSSVDIVLGAVDYIRDLHSMLEDKLLASGKTNSDLEMLRNLCGPERIQILPKVNFVHFSAL
uniref:Uncharacterized protein LOC100176581 n=1 Tax=Phallusia mammillata TaxID=59560 RepID=A0A6F9DHE3_9ASCI|nr:uncharacterized protein LOC100176581 [Phallusia mammillata]